MKKTKAISSETMVFRVHKYVPKWTLWEKTADNGMRTYSLEYQKEGRVARMVDLNTPVMRAKLRYMRDYQPEQLMELLNNGKLYLFLRRLISFLRFFQKHRTHRAVSPLFNCLVIVTVVPCPASDSTFRSDINRSMIVNPMPLRSSPPVVNRGVLARSTSSIPTP